MCFLFKKMERGAGFLEEGRQGGAHRSWEGVAGEGVGLIFFFFGAENVREEEKVHLVFILAAKLRNSDLNFAMDFWVDLFLLYFPRKKARKNPPKIPRKIHRGLCSEKFPSDCCRSLLLMFSYSVITVYGLISAPTRILLTPPFGRFGPLIAHEAPCCSTL